MKTDSPAPERIDSIALALADETRRQLLKFLVEARTPLSASMTARALAREIQRLNYHFKSLENAQLIFLADTRPVRGFTEKLFMATSSACADPIVRAALDATDQWPELAALRGTEGPATP